MSLRKTYLGKVAMSVNTGEKIPMVIKDVPKVSKETLWHQRLGHAPMRKLRMIKKIGVKEDSQDVCLACPLAKFTKLPFSKSESRAGDLFELVHIDTWGPYKVKYRGKFRYFLTFVDDYSRVTWVHLLKLKSDALNAIQSFVKMAGNRFDKQVKVIRSDNALEFDDYKCRAFFGAFGYLASDLLC